MEKIPKILYKYRPWKKDYNKDILRKNQIFLACPGDFNDPFDCRIPLDLYRLDTDEKKAQYVDKVIIQGFYDLSIKGYNVETLLKSFTQRLIDDIDSEYDRLAKLEFSFQDKFFGILSLSKYWNNIIMWAHYAENHKGYCVGFYSDKLADMDVFSKIGPVKYQNEYPNIDPMNDDIVQQGFTQTFTKAKKWIYEKEYRLYHNFFPNEPALNDRQKYFHDDALAEIILGIDIKSVDRNQIIKLAEKKNVKVFQAYKKKHSFKIIRKRIL
jgi:hypothetical protein